MALSVPWWDDPDHPIGFPTIEYVARGPFCLVWTDVTGKEFHRECSDLLIAMLSWERTHVPMLKGMARFILDADSTFVYGWSWVADVPRPIFSQTDEAIAVTLKLTGPERNELIEFANLMQAATLTGDDT